jgi:hypothetical protein
VVVVFLCVSCGGQPVSRTTDLELPYHTVNTTIRKTVKTVSAQVLAKRTSQKPWMNSLANTRTKAFANFRLLTGHDCLAKHLYHKGSLLFFLFHVGYSSANWIGHILRRNCLLKQVLEGKIKGEMEVTRKYWMTLRTGEGTLI